MGQAASGRNQLTAGTVAAISENNWLPKWQYIFSTYCLESILDIISATDKTNHLYQPGADEI